MRKLKYFCAALLTAVLLLAGCDVEERADVSPLELEYYKTEGTKIGVSLGSFSELVTDEEFPNCSKTTYNVDADACTALESGKIDAIAYDTMCLAAICREKPEFVAIDDSFGDVEIALGLGKGNDELKDKINGALAELKSNGTMTDMMSRWVDGLDYAMPKIEEATDPVGTIIVGTSGTVVPFTFYGDNNTLSGMDVELIQRIGLMLNMKVEFEVADYTSLIAGLQTGKYDVVSANLNITEERKNLIDYSDPYIQSKITLLIRKSTADEYLSHEVSADRLYNFINFDDCADYMNEKTFGVIANSIQEEIIAKSFSSSSIKVFPSYKDITAALKSGEIDAYLQSFTTALSIWKDNPELWISGCNVGRAEIGIAVFDDSKRNELNSLLSELKETGELDELSAKWLKNSGMGNPQLDEYKLSGENGIISCACAFDNAPYSFMDGENASGYEVELIYKYCEKYGYKPAFNKVAGAEILDSVAAQKYDFGFSCLGKTAENENNYLLSDTIASEQFTMILPNSAMSVSADISMDDVENLNSLVYYYNNKSIGYQDGSTFPTFAPAIFRESSFSGFVSISDAVAALCDNKIDGILCDEFAAFDVERKNNEIAHAKVYVSDDNYGFILNKSNTALCEKLNEYIGELKDSGRLYSLLTEWYNARETLPEMTKFTYSGENGLLKLQGNFTSYPMNFLENGVESGIEIEILNGFCAKNGYTPSYMNGNFASLVGSVVSDKADIGFSGISITKERAESVLFSDSYCETGTVMLSRANEFNSIDYQFMDIEQAKKLLAGQKIAVMNGTTYEKTARQVFSDSFIVNYNTYTDCISALQSNKAATAITNDVLLSAFIKDNSHFYSTDLPILEENYCFATKQGDDKLCGELNDYIHEIKKSGQLDEIIDGWLQSDERAMPELNYSGENGELAIATYSGNSPAGFIRNEEIVGFEIEILNRFAAEYGYTPFYSNMEFDGIIAGLSSGEYDIGAATLAVTEERKKTMLFTDSYYIDHAKFLFTENGIKSVFGENGTAVENSDFFAGLAASFTRTFITENRWILVVDGLGVTALIAVCSAVFGTIIGFSLCILKRSRIKALNIIVRVYTKIMQGTPVLVILMILYYIIFGNVSSIFVAIVGFSINFGAYVSEIFSAGIGAVDTGQREAACALGLTRLQTYKLVIIPQALRISLPIFKGEFISMVKMTSVVGYIAIQDLTKVSDIIRSRTYEAFFPLIATAVIYFLLSWLLTSLIGMIELKTDPLRRKRIVKGIKTNDKN